MGESVEEDDMGSFLDELSSLDKIEDSGASKGCTASNKGSINSPLSIASIDKPTYKEFTELFRNKKPVKITGLANEWPAVQKWLNDQTLKEQICGETKVPLYLAKDNHHFFKCELCVEVHTTFVESIDMIFGGKPYTEPLPNGINECEGPRRLYTRVPMLPELKKEIVTPTFHVPEGANGDFKDDLCGVWMSTQGNITPLHYDLCHGLLCQVRGSKRFYHMHPEEHRNLYPREAIEPNPLSSRMSVERWRDGDAEEREKHPRFAEVTVYETVVEEGDIIYTPPFWWHHVETLSPSISVLLPWDMSADEPIPSCAF
eukprot:Colp12_sorted_trinity150504_noHs@23182